ncbi:hypothetical protein GCM10022381_26860 [Leifsonia kafniensis]|uniref:FHA domain-containing protein n=1 Tax=Leifsonia kafniensis TaxID=475957 RepID=A0ABP7KNW0_9MICO
MTTNVILVILLWLILAALFTWISWLVIRSAVLSALRAFARSSQTDGPTGFKRRDG